MMRSSISSSRRSHYRNAVLFGAVAALATWALAPVGDAAAKDEPAKPAAAPAIGEKAPDFSLKDTSGKTHRLSDYTKKGKIVVLEWFNPDCPFSKKHHAQFKTMHDQAAALREKNVVWLAINSGAEGKQGAGRERNVKARTEYGIEYPVLLDEKGKVGRAYGAKTTPHMFVIAADGSLIYKGAIDSDRNAGAMGETIYVRAALDEYLAGKPVSTAETPSYGCSVKYAD
jgi:peroxiredoxin